MKVSLTFLAYLISNEIQLLHSLATSLKKPQIKMWGEQSEPSHLFVILRHPHVWGVGGTKQSDSSVTYPYLAQT